MSKALKSITPSVEELERLRNFEVGAFESFRRQEISLIKLNLGVIAALLVMQLSFGSKLGYPSSIAIALLGFRFVEQGIEWLLLYRRKVAFSSSVIRGYSFISPLIAILFAFVMTLLGNTEDAHY